MGRRTREVTAKDRIEFYDANKDAFVLQYGEQFLGAPRKRCLANFKLSLYSARIFKQRSTAEIYEQKIMNLGGFYGIKIVPVKELVELGYCYEGLHYSMEASQVKINRDIRLFTNPRPSNFYDSEAAAREALVGKLKEINSKGNNCAEILSQDVEYVGKSIEDLKILADSYYSKYLSLDKMIRALKEAQVATEVLKELNPPSLDFVNQED